MSLDIANTVLNASPYFDDYNEDKRFHRVLFRPAVAVQARELNQIQSIFQNQIERFGNHIFKDGSIIKGCGLSYLTDIDYVSINDQFVNNTSLSSTNSQFVNAIAIGNTTGVSAQIIAAREGFSATSSPARFFIRYTQPGANGARVFQEGEYLNLYQPGKSYIDKVVIKITTAADANTDFPNGARLINLTTRARGFITNAYSNSLGSFVELRNIRKTIANNDVLVLSTDENVSVTVNEVNLVNYANSFIDSVRVLNSNSSAGYTSLGFAYGVSVSPGIIFHKGHFIKVDSHITIVNENTRNPAGKILYFNTEEEVVKEIEDNSLYDNASGTPNLNAPGAHRLKLSSTLIARDKSGANSISNTDIAFPIVEFSETGPVFQRTNTQYNILGEELAKRTYEESGHYIVKPFGVSTKPDAANTGGFLYEVTQGLAYVKGKRVELLNNLNVPGRRGTDTESVDEAITTMSYGNYIVCKEVRGFFPVDQSIEVAIYGSAQQAITAERMPGEAAAGSIIGYANVRAVKYIDSATVKKGDPTAQYRFYLFNIRMIGSNAFQNARAIVYYDGTSNKGFADIILDNSKATLKETAGVPLLFPLNAKAVKNLRNANGIIDTNYFYTGSNTSATLSSTGVITFGIGTAKGIIGVSDGSETSENLVDVIVVDSNVASVALSGTVDASATNVITGTSTTFEADFVVGEAIEFVGLGQTHRITAIASNTQMTVNTTVTVAANTYRRVHIQGSHIPLNPAKGTKRTLTIATNRESASIDLGDSYTGTGNVSVRFYAYNNESNPISKVVNRKRVVVIQTSNNAAGSTGPWNLGVPDVFRLTGVYFGTNSSNFAMSTNRVSEFVLDSGQRDDQYNHASIRLSPRLGISSLANTFMLVEFDCFTANSSGGEGFFSVDSYPVDDLVGANTAESVKTWEIPSYFSSAANTWFDLRDSIDFRPYKANTANVTPDYTLATVNPATTSAFDANTTNYNPFPGSTLSSNFTYYLGRKDRLTLTQDGLFRVDEGIAAVKPKLPPIDPDVIVIAEVDVPPYPSLTDVEKLTVGRSDFNIILNLLSHKRFTMKDISVLEQRIQRLEYYTTLNLLEKVALQTTVADSNGDARFQNGFFVDPFNSHVFALTSDPDYRAAIDERNGYLRPAFHPENIEVEFDTDTRSYSNVMATGALVTLAYEHEAFIDQPYASDGVNVSGTPIRWTGTIDLRPSRSADIEFLAQPAAIAGTSRVAQAYSAMSTLTPGVANYGWWRESSVTSDDYQIVSKEKEERDQTSVPMETNKYVSSQEGAPLSTGIQFLCREKVYAFKAVGLKPNTTHYLFVDNINNSSLSALGEISSTPNALDETFVERNSNWGAALTTDSRGELIGKFIIPALSLKTGTHKLSVRNRATLTTGIDDSIAECYFTIDVTTVDPPVIIEPQFMLPPDAGIAVTRPAPAQLSSYAPNPTGEAGSVTDSSTVSGATSNNDIRTVYLPDIFARFMVSGDTVITSRDVSSNVVANGQFSLTFTDDSFVKNGSISSYSWDFGSIDGLIFPSSSSASGPGPHTITYNITNSVEDVKVVLKITDTQGRSSAYSKVIRLHKLLRVSALQEPAVPAPSNPEGMSLYLYPTVFNEVSDYRLYQQWSNTAFSPGLANVVNLPLSVYTYNSVAGLGSNTVLKIIAKPAINYTGYVEWVKTKVSGYTLPEYTAANITQIYVTSGGTGYSNTDIINLSNGQVQGFASLVTNSAGGITSVVVTARGNFTDGTPATTTSFTANSTANNNFNLGTTTTADDLLVSINGVVQIPTTDYTVSGTTLVLSEDAAVDDIVFVTFSAPSVTPGNIKSVNDIRIKINSESQPANATNSNTSGGSGAVLQLIAGQVSNSVSSSVANDVLTIYSNTTPGVTSVYTITGNFKLSNGYSNSVGTTTLLVTIRNSNTVISPTTSWDVPELISSNYGSVSVAPGRAVVGSYAFAASDGKVDPKYSSDSTYKQQYIKLDF